jgi:hypothetical protein
MAQTDPERADLTFFEGRRKRSCSDSRIIALLQERMHALAEFRQLSGRPLASEQLAAEFALELFDGAREGGLRDVALLGGTREVPRPRDCQEIPNLMHFHQCASGCTRTLLLPRSMPRTVSLAQ